MPEYMPNRTLEYMPDRRMSEYMPDRMPKYMPGCVPAYMPDRMPWWGSLEAKYFFVPELCSNEMDDRIAG